MGHPSVQHDLADVLRRFHQRVRRRRLREREHAVDHRLRAAGLVERPHALAQRVGDPDLPLGRAGAHRRSGHREPLQHDRHPVDLGLAAVQERDDHEPALDREAAQVLRDVVAAHHVEHQLDAALAGDRRDLGHEVAGPVVDRVIRADSPAERRLVVAADRRDHLRAERLRVLDRRVADAARAAVDQDRLARGELSPLEHVVPDGERVLRQARRLEQRQALRRRQAVPRRRDAVLRVAAAGRERADLVADAPRRDVRTDCGDRARDLESDDRRRAGRRRIVAQALDAIGAVDPGVADADQHVAGARLRHRSFGHAEHVGGAGLAHRDVAHGRGQGRHGAIMRDGGEAGRRASA